jgi:hypothetical protein
MALIIVAVLLFGSLAWFGFWMFGWQYRKAEAGLQAWARRHHYQVVAKELANPIGTGPKAARASNKQVMYRVTVSDASGVQRRALLKIGSESMGVLSNELVVEWEPPA